MKRSRFRIIPSILFVFLVLLITQACKLSGSNQPTASQPGILTDRPEDIPALPHPDTEAPPSIPTSTRIATLSPTPAMAADTATVEISPTATSRPTDTPTPITRFAVIGDFGLAGQPEADVAALVMGWEPDLIITTGDNNYPHGAAETIDQNIGQYYHAFISPYKGAYGPGAEVNRFFPTLGNHDWTMDKAQAHFDYFELPGNERYYDFVWGLVHFFAIDSDSREPDGVGRSSIQGQWLKEKLAASTATWKIVYMHQPPYSSSSEGSIDWAQWPYKEWGATAVIAGHSHVYERLIIDGFPYFVNGLGGGPIYTFNEPVPGSQARFRDDYGAMLVEATAGQITFQFITRRSQVIDSYVISP